jgi:rRNA processing protein Gar1
MKRRLFLENKTKIGIIDDVFGPIHSYVSSKPNLRDSPAHLMKGSKLTVSKLLIR